MWWRFGVRAFGAIGADVTAIDAAARNIEVASVHAEQVGLNINYRNAQPEDLAAEALNFDVVVSLEVVEHVADLDAFLAACTMMVRPGVGWCFQPSTGP